MAKLYYKFGAMGSSKTAQALMTKFNYEEKLKRVWLIKPSTDNRDDYVDGNGKTVGVVRSRIGLLSEAEIISSEDNIRDIFVKRNQDANIDVILNYIISKLLVFKNKTS